MRLVSPGSILLSPFLLCLKTTNSISGFSSFCVVLQILGVAAIWHSLSDGASLPVMLAIYLWVGLGTTLYLHRYLTHRGFEMPGWLKFIFATGSAVGAFRRSGHVGRGPSLSSS